MKARRPDAAPPPHAGQRRSPMISRPGRIRRRGAIKALFRGRALTARARRRRRFRAPRRRASTHRVAWLLPARRRAQPWRIRCCAPAWRVGGANAARGSHEDGILTALEASSLNLWGTKLVTLGMRHRSRRGRDGEGVYGLGRAFVRPVPKRSWMSLWPVSDYIARDDGGAYTAFGRISGGDALRQAKLAMLKRQREHPFYWASFIQSGEWGSLDDNRRSPADRIRPESPRPLRSRH